MAQFKNISIRKKLIIIQVATAFLAVFMCCAIFVFNNIKVFKKHSIDSKNSIAEIVGINAASTLQFMDKDAATGMLQKLNSSPSILNAAIFDKNGKQFAVYNKPGEEAYAFPSPNAPLPEDRNIFASSYLVSYRIMDKDLLGTVIIHSTIADFGEIILNYLEVAFSILLASLVAAFVISTILQRSITNRLLSLVFKTKEVTQTSNYSIRVPIEGTDEIATLSGAFNNMLTQIGEQNLEITAFNQKLEQKIKERTIQLEEANKELEAFSYSVSHDLRAPLRVISGYATMLDEDHYKQLDNDGKKLIYQIKRNTNRMGNLIDDLLAFAKLGRKEITRTLTDMTELTCAVLDEVNRSVEHHAKITIDQLLPARVDPALIQQVITNLLSNAIKYSSKKEHPEIVVSSKRVNNELIYSISDNGAGFDMQYASKLFGVFQRMHNSEDFTGTGIGLAIVKRIIDKHGGRVWAEATEGKGATFYFSLPDK